MSEDFITTSGDITSILRSKRARIISSECKNQEIRELSGEHLDLIERIRALSIDKKFEEAEEEIEKDSKAKDHPYVKFIFGQILDDQGCYLLNKDGPTIAARSFEKAREHIDACEGIFEAEQWNNEVNFFRFLTRKHQGDCDYSIATMYRSAGNKEKLLAHLNKTEKYYGEAIEIYDVHLMSMNNSFGNTAVCSRVNMGNLYTALASATAWQVDISNIASQHEKVKKAWNFINNALVMYEEGRQIKTHLEIDDVSYDVGLSNGQRNAEGVYDGIKKIYDFVSRIKGR